MISECSFVQRGTIFDDKFNRINLNIPNFALHENWSSNIPRSNCNMDMVHALENNLGYNVVELWHKDSDLQNVDAVILPGGFSYGDYLRSGAIARFSNIMEEVVKFAVNGGKVLGICNGFQIL